MNDNDLAEVAEVADRLWSLLTALPQVSGRDAILRRRVEGAALALDVLAQEAGFIQRDPFV